MWGMLLSFQSFTDTGVVNAAGVAHGVAMAVMATPLSLLGIILLILGLVLRRPISNKDKYKGQD
jgi:biopolymer transport protein ExbB/TolQ